MALLQPSVTETAAVKHELVRSLLAVLEKRDQNPALVAQTAHATLETLDKQEKEEAENKTAIRINMVAQIREGIRLLEDLILQFPGNRDYRVALAKYYLMVAQMVNNLVTWLAGFMDLHNGPSPSQEKLEATLALSDKAQASLLPDSPNMRSLSIECSIGRAATLMQLGRNTESLLALDQVVALSEASEKPRWTIYRDVMVRGAEKEQSRLPWSGGAQADHAKAVQMAEALAGHEGVSSAAIYNVACALSLASAETTDEKERERRAFRAMIHLRRIAADGYFKPKARGILGLLSGKDTLDELRTDVDLNPLRGRSGFKALLEKLSGVAAQAL